MQKITPYLWFEKNAEEAVEFYTRVFKHAEVTNRLFYGEGAPMPKGTLLTATLELEGMKFVILNGGPYYTITPAISFLIECSSQEEVDYYWDALSAGGSFQECGWLTDKYGVTWQVVPTELFTLLNQPDTEKSGRVMHAMLQMKKIIIADLQKASAGS